MYSVSVSFENETTTNRMCWFYWTDENIFLLITLHDIFKTVNDF